MSQEKHQMCSNGASGLGRSSTRKIKQNKIPQRGLGVEKLERIRLEEQRKNSGIGIRPVVPAPLPRPVVQATLPRPAVQTPMPRPGPGPGPVLGVPVRRHPRFPSSSSSRPYPSASRPNHSSLPSAPSVTNSSSTSHFPNVARNHPYVQNMSRTGSSSSAGRPPAFRWPPGARAIDNGVGHSSALISESTRFDTEYAAGSSSSLQDPDDDNSWPPPLLPQWRQTVDGPVA
ncbi:hypothetical protein AQUCO_05500083v1, partial [Aquilegia coerulea]